MPSKKAKKDPNAPKRALSSYMLFANDVRKEITTAEPTLSMVDVSKRIGERWKRLDAVLYLIGWPILFAPAVVFLLFLRRKRCLNLCSICGYVFFHNTQEEKQPYEETAAELKSEYVVAKTKYDTDKAKTAAPKKPMSAYMHFSVGVRSEVQRENPDMAFGAVAKEISKRWNSLDAEDKGEYEDKVIVVACFVLPPRVPFPSHT